MHGLFRRALVVAAGLSLPLVFVSAGAASANQLASPAGHSPATVAATGPHVKLSPSSGPPTTTVTVSGSGFGATEGVDVYFDTTDLALAGTTATGSFGPVTITVPASATPGKHWVSSEGRHSGLFAQTAFTVSTTWAQFHYSGKRKGSNPFENVLNADNVSGIDQAWGYTTGGPITSSPAVANGVVYIGSAYGDVIALNASSGAVLWDYEIGDPVYSSPAVANGVVYIGDIDGNFYALNASTGAQLWTDALTGYAVGFDSAAAVANGVVYVGALDGNVYALNASTGAQRWSYTTGGGVSSSPAVANGVVYVGSADGNVYGLSPSTDAQLWSSTTGNYVESSPAVTNGVVYIGSGDGNLYAFSLAGGLATPAHPRPGNLHPNYSLQEQRQ